MAASYIPIFFLYERALPYSRSLFSNAKQHYFKTKVQRTNQTFSQFPVVYGSLSLLHFWQNNESNVRDETSRSEIQKKSDHCLRLSSEGAEVSVTLIWQTSLHKSGFDILLIFISFRNKKTHHKTIFSRI